MKFVHKEPVDSININVSSNRPFHDFLVLFFGSLGIILAVYLLLGLTVDLIASKKNPDLERKLASFFPAKSNETTNADLERILKGLLERVPPDGLEYSVSLVLDDKTENAVIFPGRKIHIYSGLLKNITSENELAFILSHEIGHAENNDHIRGMGRGVSMIIMSTLIMGSDNTIGRIFADSITKADRAYSQAQESKADLFALDLVNKHYGHISGSTDFFARLGKKEIPAVFFFATHPSSKTRIERMRKEIALKGYKEGQKTAFRYQ